MSDGRRLVVGVAIERDGRWLVARRTRPPALAGLWEFPGGKVEPGESVADAARREIAEELDLAIIVTGSVGEPDQRWPIDDRFEMVVVTATADHEPRPRDGHDATRWVPTDELVAVDWLPADVAVAHAVANGVIHTL